jgi:hypothetical protein
LPEDVAAGILLDIHARLSASILPAHENWKEKPFPQTLLPPAECAAKSTTWDKLPAMRNAKQILILITIVLLVIVLVWLVRREFPVLVEQSPAGHESPQAHTGPVDIYPDPTRTPGAVNPEITQENIRQTICSPRWSTKSIRPDESYTHQLKVKQIREYGYSDTRLRAYEEDHFIPLELGGNPTDPRNLWPEPFETSIADGGAQAKNLVEVYLHAEVCSGSLTLQQAQREITEDWYRVYTTSVPH